MKTTTLAITLTAFVISAGFAIAQNTDEHVAVQPPDASVAVPNPHSVSDEERRLAGQKDQLKQAQRALASSQKEMQLAQAQAGEVGKTFTTSLIGLGVRNDRADRSLVIPKDASDAKSLADVEEDLSVMAHILSKAVSDDGKAARAMGIPVWGRMSGGGASPQNIYIEGYGALFFLDVNYPLMPPPEKAGDRDAREKTNSEWEQARREMSRSSPAGGADDFDVVAGNLDTFGHSYSLFRSSAAPYDADKVEALKRDLISAMKNAANIRRLKPDETVTVVVTAAGAGGSAGRTIRNATYGSGKGGQSTFDPATGLPVTKDEEVVITKSSPGERGTPGKLILRVRKADGEAFQSGKLSLDEFRKKATVMLY